MSSFTIGDCVIVRCLAGHFFGYVDSESGAEITLVNSRRLWYWAGAATLCQLAMEGTKKPMDCKVSMFVPEKRKLFGVIEILKTTEEAKKSIEEIPIWKA
jgi:hypothetical protein